METLPSQAFQRGRLLRDGTWVVAFLADWCPFCRRFRPVFEALDGGGAFRTGVADVTDDDSPLWDQFGLEVIPALLVFSRGRPTFRREIYPGAGLPADALERASAAARESLG